MSPALRVGLFLVLLIALGFLVTGLAKNAVLLDSLKNADPSAAVDAIRGYTGAEIATYSFLILAVIGIGIWLARQPGNVLDAASQLTKTWPSGSLFSLEPEHLPLSDDEAKYMNIQTMPEIPKTN